MTPPARASSGRVRMWRVVRMLKADEVGVFQGQRRQLIVVDLAKFNRRLPDFAKHWRVALCADQTAGLRHQWQVSAEKIAVPQFVAVIPPGQPGAAPTIQERIDPPPPADSRC